MKRLLSAVMVACVMASTAEGQVCTNANASQWLQRGYCKLGNVDIRMNAVAHDVYQFDPFISILTGPGYIDLTMTGERVDGFTGGNWINSLFTWDLRSHLYIESLIVYRIEGGMIPMPDASPYSWDNAVTMAEIFGPSTYSSAYYDQGQGPQTVPIYVAVQEPFPAIPANHFVTGMRMQQGLDGSTGTQYATTNWIDSVTFRITMGPGTPTIAPEPSTYALTAAGLLALLAVRRRRVVSTHSPQA